MSREKCGLARKTPSSVAFLSKALLERFADGSRPVIDRSSSCSRYIVHGIACLHRGFLNVSCRPV
jgi:hypothetical protein